MVSSKPKAARRLTTSTLTAVVLLAGITVILESASAVDVTVTPSNASVSTAGEVVLTVVVTFESDEFIPVTYLRAIFEGPTPPASIARDIRWFVNGDILSNDGCSSVTVSVANSGLATVGYGFGSSTTYLGRHTGYGYDASVGHGTTGYGSGGGHTGQGYSEGEGVVPGDVDVFNGYGAGEGYGYTSGEGTLTYTVTVPGSCFSVGAYRVTAEVATDYWNFQSLFTTVTITTPGGSGPGAGGGTPTGNTGAGQTQTITATATTVPAGAAAAYTATVATASAGNTIIINTGDPIIPSVTFVTAQDISNAVVTIVRYDPTSPPSSAPALPSGLDPAAFFEITITSASGSIQKVTLAVNLPASEVPDATKGVLLRNVNGVWVVESKLTLTLEGGVYKGTGESGCCSVFAVAFDTTPPQISLAVPGGTVTGAETIRATATDNLQLSKVDFYVDGTLKGTDTSSPYEYAFDGKAVNPGQHTIRGVATDFVGNTAEDSENVQTAGGTEGPQPPAPKAGGVPGWVWFLIIVLVIALIIGAVVMSGKKK